MKSNHKLLVIVVTYNAMKWIDKCLGSVIGSQCKPDIYVVDNGSTDDTINYIIEHYPNIIFYQSKENLGFGKGNNLGLKYALDNEYDYVYLLNQDAWVFHDTFDKLMEIFDRNTGYGIISPIQCQANLHTVDKNFMFNTFNIKNSSEFLNDLYFGNTKDLYEVSFVMAAHWMLSRDCLLKVGGFSPTFPHYGEDGNYIHRVKFHGMKIGIVPFLNVVHDREYRVESWKKKIYMTYIFSLIYFSNIQLSASKRFFFAFKYSVKQTLRLKSLAPLYQFFKVLSRIGEINTNNSKSKQIGTTFLK